MTTMAELNEMPGRLAELIDQVKAGHEVVLTEGQKPVARLIAAGEERVDIPVTRLRIKGLRGHRVLKPTFTHAEIADEIFGE